MSHLDAPLRPRRHHLPSDVFSRQEKGVDTPGAAVPTLNEPVDNSSSSLAAGTRSLKSLLLPAQIELRRVFQRQRRRDFDLNDTDSDERAQKRFKTDSSFHLHRVHRLDERQARSTTSTKQLGAALSSVGSGTDCQAFADQYGSGRTAQVLLACERSKAAAVKASQEANWSRAAATSTSRRIRTSTTSSRGSTRKTSTAARAPATPRIAAPVTTSLSPAQASALSRSVIQSVVSDEFSQAASVVASRASVASASRAQIRSSVDSLFSVAASVVASREGLLPTVTSASTASPSSASLPSSTSSASSSSASSASSASAISSSATPSSTADPARSNHNRIAKIVGPSVAIPLGLLLLALLAFCCLKRRRRRKNATGAYATASGRSTPGGLGPISHPQPLHPSGAMREYGAVGAGADLAAGARARRGDEPGSSQESLGPTPSAIGVAYSEPRTKWGRRSLVDVLAGGVRGANSGSDTPDGSGNGSNGVGGGGHQRGLSTSSSFGGRQPSIRSSASIPSELRGVGGYNIYGYQPGQPRPVMSMTSPLSSHYDPFGPGAIVPVPESARNMHPVSSEEGSISGYSEGPGGSGSGGRGRSGSGESLTAVLAPPLAAGYAHSRQAQQSRTTQQTSEGEQGYWTADAGQSSADTHTQETGYYEEAEEEPSGDLSGSPQEEAVNFGSGSSSGGSGAGTRASEERTATPMMDGSRTSTPRLGMGHGSIGSRRNDGTGSWWNA